MTQRRSSVMPTRSSHVSWMTIHVPSVPVREMSMCVFLQSDTVITIFLWCTFGAATIQGWLLFEGGVYFFGKPADINDGWIRYV